MSATADDLTGSFEPHRAHLRGLAYRMLGSHADADDAVQEAWLRWRDADRAAVASPRAFLSRTVTNLCLDRLKSAQQQREVYVGPWLPEPVMASEELMQPGPEAASEFASDLSYAFLLALERLSPLERAAFLLHDVFDAGFDEVAETLGRSEAAVRQLASRARTQIREGRPRFAATSAQTDRLAVAFLHAAQSGDVEGLRGMLAQDARFVSDGGGRVAAAGIPIVGRDRVAKAVHGFATKHSEPGWRVQLVRVNGQSGCLVTHADGTPIQTLAFEVDDAGQVAAIYVVRNPEKLRHLAVH